MAHKGQTARFLYRGSFPNGEVFDDCEGIPHEIILGRRQVMKALEDALLEMEPGEERTVELAAVDAYGEYDESAVQHFPTYKVPNGENLPVGEYPAQHRADSGQGGERRESSRHHRLQSPPRRQGHCVLGQTPRT